MPKGQASGGAVANAFAAEYGAISGSVKMSYLGKDRNGNSIYKFTYQTPSRTASYLSGRGTSPTTATTTRTLAVGRDGGAWRFAAPGSKSLVAPIAGNADVDFSGSSVRSDMEQRAVAKIGELISRGLVSVEEGKTLASNVRSMSDTALRIFVSRGGSYTSMPAVGGDTTAQDALADLFGSFDGFGGGAGGGGGGFAGPQYVAPDRGLVEDFAKGVLVSLVGNVPEHLVGPAVERYMRDHRRNFDSLTEGIDPQMSVLEMVRGTREYQTIHKLRPESVDERDWISDRAQQAQRGGLDTAEIEDFAIQQATIGGDLPDVAQAAAVSQFQRSGQAPALLDQRFREVAQSMFARVR